MIDLLHAGVSHIYEGPHLRHGGVAFLQLHLLPAIHAQRIQHSVQPRLRRRQIQAHGAGIAGAEKANHIGRLSGRPAQVGRSLPQLGFPYYIAVRGHSAVFVPAHFFTDLGIVQQLQHTIRHLFQLRQEIVLHIEPAQCRIIPDLRHHMTAIHAVRQIQQSLEGQFTAIGLAQLVDLHLHQSLKDNGFYMVECAQLLRQSVELIQVAVIKERCKKTVSANVLHLPIGFPSILQPQLIQCIYQFPRRGGQIQLCVITAIRITQIYGENLFIQAPYPLSAAQCPYSYPGLRQVHPNRTCCRSS